MGIISAVSGINRAANELLSGHRALPGGSVGARLQAGIMRNRKPKAFLPALLHELRFAQMQQKGLDQVIHSTT
jgi:hypothetical protein